MRKRYRGHRSFVPQRAVFRGAVLALLLAAIFWVGFLTESDAQSQTPLSPDLLNQLQQFNAAGQGGANGQSGNNSSIPQPLTLQPAISSSQAPLPPSRLEQIMSERAGTRLQQFGYDQLGHSLSVTIPQTGAVQDDYILGPGDEIVVSLRGQENGEFRAMVDRNGQVILPRVAPIPATGRSFGSLRQDLEAAIHRTYVATDASISVGRVRQISVLVSGEVNVPGQRLVTGLSSVVDALLLSGGVKKTGSLRDIRIQRGGHQYTVDLYSVLTTGGTSASFRLADGDRILVPVLGKTAAVTGLVRQPGIYELAPQQASISGRNLLSLAGGEEVRGNYHLSVMQIDQQGRGDLHSLTNEAGLIRDSEILFVELGADQMTSRAILSGGVGLAGSYPVIAGTKLSDVLKAPGALGTSPYTLFGIISRKDPRTLLRTLVAFTPTAVLNGSEDQALQSDDIIRPFTTKETRLVNSTIRIYLQQRDQDEQALLNPSSAISNIRPPDIVSATTTGGSTTPTLVQNGPVSVVEGGIRSSSEEAQNEEAEIQFVGSFTQRQLDMVTSGQARTSEFRYLPEQGTEFGYQGTGFGYRGTEFGYRGVYLPSEMLQNQGASSQSINSSGLPTSRYGEGLPVPPQQVYGGNNQAQYQGNGENNRPPAPNFQEATSAPGVFPNNREAPAFNVLAQQLGVEPIVLLNFVIDHQITLDGAVRGPGSYFVGPGASLKDLVEAAGGTINWADDSGVELISTAVDANSGRSITQRVQLPLQQGLLASYIVKPHDGFRFNKVYSDGDIGNVTVQGEVRFTGNYRITRGEHLSDLLARAGGLTSVAYPYGTVFLRKSAADKEREGYIRAASEVEDQLVVAMTRIGNDKIDATTFASMQSFVNQLRAQPPIGRISITADPSILAAKAELDPLLETGDVVYIPQRPSTISVLGQVAQPGSFPYRPGLALGDYIQQAGGYSVTSDESMTFIVLPDGSARKMKSSWLSFDSESLPPGSTIVVPRDVTPLETRQVILDITAILSQLAVSVASLAVLSTVH